jgi:D-alanyl-lipoteichoic acid acyltransferase DltB (MBOAT superfamily)
LGRWHITLSRFLKEYIYIPLGGNRKGEFRTYSNLLITFLLGGIWHGAGWTFVFWGLLHGVALMIHRAWQKLGKRLPILLAWFLTFNFINIAWVFFRANAFEDALKVLKGMFGFSGVGYYHDISHLYILLGFVVTLLFYNVRELVEKRYFGRYTFFITSVLLMFALLQMFNITISSDKVSEFLYFNF